jgi:DNA helicase-2/ATP-dependent DNA helicase PcrA
VSSQHARLNSAQSEAVEHAAGPLLVLAGAGSGKTRVITHRIVRLLEGGVPAAAIVALTFTNKAAGEMRERVARALGPRSERARALTLGTFHAFGLTVLGREREAVGGSFTIFDQGDQISLVKQLLRAADADRSYDAAVVLARLSNAKNALRGGADMPDREGDEYDEIAKVLYPRYQAALRHFKAFDFDDLVCEVTRLWQENEAVRARWQSRFLHVLVDEYQDTNRAQLEFLRMLAGERRNVCAVGDDDQAIYSWRGADVRNVLSFAEHFPGARVIKLEQNYRSRAPILAVANAVIARRADGKPESWRKVLFTERAGGEKALALVAPTPEAEAAWVGREVRRLLREQGTSPREIAVLYRSNAQSRLVEEALREQGIAHRVLGGAQFFERKEVKDLLAYMKLALNLADEISLRRILNYPPRGIGEGSLEKLALHAARRQWSLWQCLDRVDALDDVPNAAREGCRALVGIVEAARRDLLVAGRAPSQVAREICERAGILAEIAASAPSPDAAARRGANLEGLLGTLARREQREGATADGGSFSGARGPGAEGLAAFLRALTMDFESEGDAPTDVVTLSTLHGSKGLEFEVVFLIGCEEGYLPHARTLDARATDAVDGGASDLEEERRLFYVGVTRAKERLVLSRAKTRTLRGKVIPRTPSRFLLEVPAELLEQREAKEEKPTSVAEATANVEAILALLGPR